MNLRTSAAPRPTDAPRGCGSNAWEKDTLNHNGQRLRKIRSMMAVRDRKRYAQ